MRRLRVAVSCPDSVSSGEPVSFILLTENVGTGPVELYLTGRAPLLDVVITSATGEVVWHRLRDAIHEAILRLELLEPGESLRVGARWDGMTDSGNPPPEGTYAVVASLLTDGSVRIESAPRSLTVRA